MDFTQIFPLLKDGGLLGLTIWLLWEARRQQQQRDIDTKEERKRTFDLLDKYGDALKGFESGFKELKDEIHRLSERVDKIPR